MNQGKPKNGPQAPKPGFNLTVWLLLAAVLAVLNGLLYPHFSGEQIKNADYMTFISEVDQGK
ncbi:MAG: hypothetical protein IK129_01495, partial [Deltaproteobacteria bacterium]|nr:hypothetical protein [Deltaproteobacteria bacterium]